MVRYVVTVSWNVSSCNLIEHSSVFDECSVSIIRVDEGRKFFYQKLVVFYLTTWYDIPEAGNVYQ
jgi:hypothetical protein